MNIATLQPNVLSQATATDQAEKLIDDFFAWTEDTATDPATMTDSEIQMKLIRLAGGPAEPDRPETHFNREAHLLAYFAVLATIFPEGAVANILAQEEPDEVLYPPEVQPDLEPLPDEGLYPPEVEEPESEKQNKS